MKVSCFEDLDCWQGARTLTKSIYRQTANGKFSRDYGLRDQMRRAGVSFKELITMMVDSDLAEERLKLEGTRRSV